MNAPGEGILRTVSEYYTDKIRTHGATPRGMDWNDPGSQALRFEQLARLLPRDGLNQTGFTGEHKARKVSNDQRKCREPFFDRSARARGAHGS